MPELPEVETTKKELKSLIINKFIDKVLIYTKFLRIPLEEAKLKKLEGKKITNITRKAKYIIIKLNNFYSIIIHLGMTGRLLSRSFNEPRNKHDHIVLRIKKGCDIVFNDVRKFGFIAVDLQTNLQNNKFLKHLGAEPLSKNFSPLFLEKILKKSSAPIKNVLLNQKLISGIGNIYACESLFDSGILPQPTSNKIKKKKITILCKSIKKILKRAIKSKGSSIDSFKLPSGELGTFQNNFSVYGREGNTCLKSNCYNKIKRIKIAGRSTFYCSSCQN